ncbi:MAG: biotin--[acetyl-CoA-carboxylase] ligase, partial [Pseudomonadota bacterium]|nr:biotin--[acetyl-CoA-carboxylase] ligase [Pseudomonadota bacterium]
CQVKLTRDNEMLLIGTVRGVSDKGALLVEAEGKQVEIVSGEVSLIGV